MKKIFTSIMAMAMDCIVTNGEDYPTDKATHPALDNHGSSLASQGALAAAGNPTAKGLPNDGKITTEDNHVYQLASYTGDNGMFLNHKGEQGTLVFASEVKRDTYTTIGILYVGANITEGGSSMKCDVTLNYTDDTSETVEGLAYYDWNSGHSPYAYQCSMRFRADGGNPEDNAATLYELVVPFSKDLKSVTITNQNEDSNWGGGQMFTAFAVSAWTDVTKVVLLGGFNEWKQDDYMTKGDGYVWTKEVDATSIAGDIQFKLLVNGSNWIGNGSTMVIDAPDNWVTGQTDGDWNYVLNNSKTGYQTYTVTATWDKNDKEYNGWTLKIEGKDERTSTPEVTYYLVGTFNEWAEKDENYKLTKNEAAETEEYSIEIEFAAAAEIKVMSSDGAWYPDGLNNNYSVAAGKYDIYFRPNADGGDGWHYNYIYAAKQETDGISNIAAETLKTAVIYNINGQRVSQPSRGLYIMNGKKVVLK